MKVNTIPTRLRVVFGFAALAAALCLASGLGASSAHAKAKTVIQKVAKENSRKAGHIKANPSSGKSAAAQGATAKQAKAKAGAGKAAAAAKQPLGLKTAKGKRTAQAQQAKQSSAKDASNAVAPKASKAAAVSTNEAPVVAFKESAKLIPQDHSAKASATEAVKAEKVHAAPVEVHRKEKITQHLTEKYKKPYASVRQVVDLAWNEAQKHPHLSPEVVLAVIQKESGLDASASSNYGAKGYMQVVKRFHAEKLHPKESLYAADVNIRVGTQILQEYAAQQKGNLRAALSKYSGNARGYADYVLAEARKLRKIG